VVRGEYACRAVNSEWETADGVGARPTPWFPQTPMSENPDMGHPICGGTKVRVLRNLCSRIPAGFVGVQRNGGGTSLSFARLNGSDSSEPDLPIVPATSTLGVRRFRVCGLTVQLGFRLDGEVRCGGLSV
jgi:hypothetical protein